MGHKTKSLYIRKGNTNRNKYIGLVLGGRIRPSNQVQHVTELAGTSLIKWRKLRLKVAYLWSWAPIYWTPFNTTKFFEDPQLQLQLMTHMFPDSLS